MAEITIVLPSARAIRHEQLALKEETLFLPNYITMSDFTSKLCRVKGYKYIDDDTRTLLLLEASHFKNFEKLQIERNFFTFTKNSQYIFSFFQELSSELYDIKNLQDADIYAEYEEHIEILIHLYKRYEALCNEKKLLDRIFLPKLYTFHTAYARLHEKVQIHVDGLLTNFELELLEKLSHYTVVELVFHAARFNTKMQNKFTALGFEIERGYKYLLDFNNKKILSKDPLVLNTQVHCESLSENLLQGAFVKQKLYEFIQKGYKPENIVVVLPNEHAAGMLKTFDKKHNFNFAMGESFSQSSFYKKLQASVTIIEQQTQENLARFHRVGDEMYALIAPVYYKNSTEYDIMELLRNLLVMCETKQEQEIIEKELYSFTKLLEHIEVMPIHSLLKLFMQRLAKNSFDDVLGGKITVMGVLETRSISFDGVILIDFDENNVPKKSQKDMFLNTKLREFAKLPTALDRENLQKHYYEMLLHNAKEVAVSYVASAQTQGSRFLKQLKIKQHTSYDEKEYASILFPKALSLQKKEEEIIVDYTFAYKELSATKLKTYLTCKRKFYYQYIQGLKDHTIAKDIPQEFEIGSKVHAALKSLYEKQTFYNDVTQLQRDVERELDALREKNPLDSYLIALQKKKLQAFCKNEIEHFHQGWKVLHCETFYKREYKELVISGHIDRIDTCDEGLGVFDYKTGNYTLYNKKNVQDANDFQLEFYTYLTQAHGRVIRCGFYDLTQGNIVDEVLFEEKMALMMSHFEDLLRVESLECVRCEDTKHCLYCPYKILCQRD